MTDAEAALLRAVLAAPGDPLPRLVERLEFKGIFYD